MKSQKLASFKHFFFLAFALFLCFSLTRNIFRMLSTQSRLDDSQAKLAGLKEEQNELSKTLQKVESPAFTEAQIRNQLGLAKKGEIILVFPEDNFVRRLAPNSSNPSTFRLPDPNWKIWLNLFL